MAENPLLPDAELRSLLANTRRCVALDAAARKKASKAAGRSAFIPAASREALLAGTAMQLQEGDLMLGEPGDSTAAAFAAEIRVSSAPAISLLPESGKGTSRMMLATAMAAALRATGTDRLVLTPMGAGATQPGWPDALAWAQQDLLPLVVVCADPRGAGAFLPASRKVQKDAMEWGFMRRTAAKLKLPVLTVDGEDAVAVYRVMQESVLRARAGGGPAVLWAMLPSAKEAVAARPRSASPVGRLQQYLRTRKISF